MVRDRPVSEQARVCDAGDTMTDRDALIARLREESQWFGSRHWGDRGFREHGESATALMQQAADALAAPPPAPPKVCPECGDPLSCIACEVKEDARPEWRTSFGWMIETRFGGVPHWFEGIGGNSSGPTYHWTTDPARGIRLCRREDVVSLIDSLNEGAPAPMRGYPSQHGWCDLRPEVVTPIGAPAPADQPALVALGERLRTQDNQMTAHPIFVVEHRDDARRPWEFVTACLTDEGARAYMNANGHNLRKFSRIFVHSGYRNDEWIWLRNHLMSLPAAPPVTDTPQGMDDSRCAVCGWPLDPEGKMCLRGSCSQRPLPKVAVDPVRAVAEYEAAGHRVEFSEALARWCEQADAATAAPPQEDQ